MKRYPENSMHSKSPFFRAGFSLLEIMVAAAIIAIIAAIAYPSYSEAVRKARRAEGRAAMMQLMQQQERYYSRYNTYVAFSRADPKGFKWFSGNAAPSSAYEISATACDDETLQNCVLLTARPGTEYVNAHYRDDLCGTLTLASSGVQGAAGNIDECW